MKKKKKMKNMITHMGIRSGEISKCPTQSRTYEKQTPEIDRSKNTRGQFASRIRI